MNEKREKLAELCHAHWANWMNHLFKKCYDSGSGEYFIPHWDVSTWKRQVETPYAELPNDEKKTFERKADMIIDAIEKPSAQSVVINYTGAHGTGKTTCARKLATELEDLLDEEIGFIHDTARSCPFPIVSTDTKTSPEAQQWIFTTLMMKQLNARSKYRITVSDRSLVDAVGYSFASGFNELAQGMLELLKSTAHENELFIFNNLSTWGECFKDDGRRQTDYFFAKRVQTNILLCHHALGHILNEHSMNKPLTARDIVGMLSA